MDYENLFNTLKFNPKENAAGIFSKKYPQAEDYCIEINFEKQTINYGDKIQCENKTTQNFSQPENFVVLECVNRLIEKGYKPENIVLEKTWGAGHGTSGRLDICVTRDDGSEYLLIECKTFGKEFDKEFTRMKKDGGQLFTYFKFSNKADVIMLYASELKGKELIYKNEIIKIEDDYRTGDIKDFYEKWNKLTKDNGIFEEWVKPYDFESKALTINELEDIKLEDSSFIFNRFLEILRHNVVSDKPNAFNKIFTLFLCKIYDEKINEGTENELGFQWIEGVDNDVSFQLRLTDLYKNGMDEFLDKKVTDFSEEKFDNKFQQLFVLNDSLANELKEEINRIRLEKNNEFAIKEVYDRKSFNENAKVVKEVVELLQKYKIRYTQKQQYLSDFFELLLTTGLKQESGQFFTPVPIAQFIIKSLPIDQFVETKLQQGKRDDMLPYIIDYAAGSGHFVTEAMHEIQRQLNAIDTKTLKAESRSFVDIWRIRHFDWALQYIYGIEKDYRLVKVGKVGCYLHGDGLANVIHSDGLASFDYPEYKNKLSCKNDEFPKDNKQFDILLSNPPYSVSAFRNTARDYYTEKDFELYNDLTDNSSEIECLFVERAKQLLKNGGVAGIILPKSILEKGGVYTKTREIILKYFEIIAITELGSNTFMATGTNTVVLFLRRRNNYDCQNFAASLENSLTTYQDNTINGIEKPITRYINHVWINVNFADYISLIQNIPNENIQNHEFYKIYRKSVEQKMQIEIVKAKKNRKTQLSENDIQKIKNRTEKECFSDFIEIEKEKLLYFILAYPQKIVLIKTGEKEDEKHFLGYKFSDRREMQGIFPMQVGKTIEECTQLFDSKCFENFEKASSYIYKAFNGIFDLTINENLTNNVFYCNLIQLFAFNNANFEKDLSLTFKEKVEFESKWDKKRLGTIFIKIESGKRPNGGVAQYRSGVPSLGGEHIGNNGKMNYTKMKFVPEEYFQSAQQGIVENLDILLCKDGALTGKVALFKKSEFQYPKGMINEHVFALKTDNETTQKYVFYVLCSEQGQKILKANVTGTAQGGLNRTNLMNIQIPFPEINIQKYIVSEIENLEEKAKTIVIPNFDKEIEKILKKYL